MNALECPLNLVGWQGSQVNAHAKTLAGTVNTASLNSEAVQGGHVFRSEFLCLSSLEEAPPSCNKVRIHLYLLFAGFITLFLAYFKGKNTRV